ncbi:hypothetical protein QFC19_003695 [Naganishia cerealis]|uniref:Uncharacterized protein n=1 Tax=Naganishia cerealis TaxID=610337 RepID=A0ACC2W100_9TREE|nr:hypothetical protein QFC19_003695 [Naganishia cerealis]
MLALLDLFRPKAMSPNTLLPFLKGADYYAMIAAFGDCLALGGKEELRAKCLRWFRREKGLVNEAEVWNFARDMLLFQGAEGSSGGGNAEMDLRAGRSANRQRQSEAFLPTLPFATKSTLNSPKADTIPRGPTIAISPSKLTRNVEHVPVFGKTDVHGYIEEYLVAQENLMEEDDQDTQVQKSREMRSERSAKSVLAERGRDNRRSEENRKTDLSDNEPQRKRYIVYPAPANLGGIVKHAMGDPTNPKPDIQTPVSMGDGVHRHSSGVILTSRSARSSSRILLGPKINTNRAKSKDNIR